ncbi:hypothetical protein FB451DRAFT_162211 [Mycena latifolia]|nr:hypothetical protein FB451DRAFT_162211 [Mycena latifolia]
MPPRANFSAFSSGSPRNMALAMALAANGSQLTTGNATVGAAGPMPNFELMFAPLLIGVVLNVLLFGVFIVQVHSYFRMYKTDYAWIRYLMYYLIVLETINTVCDVGLIYEPLILLHNSPLATVNFPRLLAADPIVTTLISTPTQLFMAWRIKLVTKSWWFSGLVALLTFASLTGSLVATIGVAHITEFRQFVSVEAPITVWLTSTAFADIFITVFLVNFLWTNKTGFQTQTDSVADRIIFFSVQTGTLTSFAAIADCVLFLIVPSTTLMFIWDFSLSKLYSICLIATLNARNEWNTLLDDLPPATGPGHRKGSGSGSGGSGNGIIKIREAVRLLPRFASFPPRSPHPRPR